jgi:transcriptional regulator with XRE-family HTH domain
MNRPEADASSSRATDHRIEAVREERGLTRSQLARRSGVSRRKLAAFESGAAVPSPAELAAVAQACGVGADAIATPAPDATGVARNASSGSPGEIRGQVASDALLHEYLTMLKELRRASAIAPVSLRESDIAELATALGRTPEAVKARLVELLATHDADTSEVLAFLTS